MKRDLRVGIYPGSFNPFHIGHQNIFDKASLLFDKIVVAQGINLEKSGGYIPLRLNKRFKGLVEEYDGLLTDFIKDYLEDNIDNNITIIRGFRNLKDVEYQQEQDFWCKELYPQFKSIYIECDKEFKHISSTAIKRLQQYKQNISQYLP
jgi:pantetheine-phosphate adenylyltransferase